MKQGQTVLSVPSKYLLPPPWHNSKLLFFQAIMLLDFSLPGQLFHIERFVDWGDLEIAYFDWHAQSGHRAITKISRYWVQAGYRQGIDQLWSSFGLYRFVSYLKIALAHAHTDCNSPRALVAALPGGGTLGISGWGCATGTLEPLTYTRASSAEFCYPILG